MSNKPATTTTKPAAAKSASITMRANGSMLTLLALRTEKGAVTTVTTKHPNEKAVRGMTEQHKTFEAAKARIDALAKDAEKQGWVRGKFQPASKPPRAEQGTHSPRRLADAGEDGGGSGVAPGPVPHPEADQRAARVLAVRPVDRLSNPGQEQLPLFRGQLALAGRGHLQRLDLR